MIEWQYMNYWRALGLNLIGTIFCIYGAEKTAHKDAIAAHYHALKVVTKMHSSSQYYEHRTSIFDSARFPRITNVIPLTATVQKILSKKRSLSCSMKQITHI